MRLNKPNRRKNPQPESEHPGRLPIGFIRGYDGQRFPPSTVVEACRLRNETRALREEERRQKEAESIGPSKDSMPASASKGRREPGRVIDGSRKEGDASGRRRKDFTASQEDNLSNAGSGASTEKSLSEGVHDIEEVPPGLVHSLHTTPENRTQNTKGDPMLQIDQPGPSAPSAPQENPPKPNTRSFWDPAIGHTRPSPAFGGEDREEHRAVMQRLRETSRAQRKDDEENRRRGVRHSEAPSVGPPEPMTDPESESDDEALIEAEIITLPAEPEDVSKVEAGNSKKADEIPRTREEVAGRADEVPETAEQGPKTIPEVARTEEALPAKVKKDNVDGGGTVFLGDDALALPGCGNGKPETYKKGDDKKEPSKCQVS
jgi:hypothetical protein